MKNIRRKCSPYYCPGCFNEITELEWIHSMWCCPYCERPFGE